VKRSRLPLILTVLLTGCDDDAIRFANQTHALLNEYQKRINDQISATSKYYTADSEIGKTEARRQLNSTLSVDRDERSTQLAADYLEGRKPPSLYRTELRSYAQSEYDARKASYAAAVDASLPYVQQLAKLQADKETVEALGKALEALEKKRSLKTEAEDLKGFVDQTKSGFNLLVCADLKTQKADLTEKIKTATGTAKTELQSQSDAVDKLRKDRKCDEAEKADADRKAAEKAAAEKAAAEKAALAKTPAPK